MAAGRSAADDLVALQAELRQVIDDLAATRPTAVNLFWALERMRGIVEAGSGGVGGSRRSLNINTWADKCVFQGDNTLYCAVPLSLPKGAGLERSIADTITDSVMKVDLLSGTSSFIGQPEQATSITSLVVSADGSKLYYTGEDGTLKELLLR